MVNQEEKYIYDNCKKINELINIKSLISVEDPANDLLNFNMSMIRKDEEYLSAFRSTDFKPPTKYAGKISFINLAKLVENKLVDIERLYFNGYGIRLWDKYNAMEDPKLIEWNGSTWCLFTRPNFYITKITMVILNLDTKEFIYFDDPLGRDYTKNWMPYVKNDRLFLVTDIDPLMIYEVKNSKLEKIFISDDKKYTTPIHGSSNIIEFDEKLVGLIHGRFDIDNKWFYWHRMVSWNSDWSNMKFGKVFKFEIEGVEFSTCLLKEDEFISIPYSIKDESISIINIDNEEFRKIL